MKPKFHDITYVCLNIMEITQSLQFIDLNIDSAYVLPLLLFLYYITLPKRVSCYNITSSYCKLNCIKNKFSVGGTHSTVLVLIYTNLSEMHRIPC